MKSKGVAYLLHIFLGFLGAGRFYVGDIGMGILNLLTLGGFGVLWFIDLFLLSGRVDYKNALFAARTATNNINNVNTVQVNIDPNMLKNMQSEAAATAEPKVEDKKEEPLDLSKPRF
ncbi:TM2 domain-containing protein [Bacillus bingmayongensis]|uniref:TM2 domain-containing protein n=1 Tax=Bacillus bingmayongensis TaxID=1150157 RepID=UPI00030E470C|nr:TM2 domain-containing protein [Bacillus bingmayongensis]MBY0598985.1 TM2 domain-containing protein [Bacillus bingmayongensis]